VQTSSAFSATGVQTIHIRAKLLSIPTGNSFPNRFFLVGFDAASGENRTPYLCIGQTIVLVGWFDTSANAFREISITTTHNTTDWRSYVVVWDFTTTTGSVKVFRDGIQLGTTYTGTRGTPALSTFTTLARNARTNEHADAIIADYGFWNAELNADEMGSLADGFPVACIRPPSLQRDVTMIRNSQDTRAGTTVTAINAPSVSSHPRNYP
jgi:hypothetical protein